MDYEKNHSNLIELIVKQFKLNIEGTHGIKHWRRVYETGNYLAKHTNADIEVVNLFAYLHDSKRENENDDLEHGKRASIFVKELYDKKLIEISPEQLTELMFSCEHHSNSNIKSDNITIQTCWDSDRLDLWRVGIVPDPFFLNTPIAKEKETIEFSRLLNLKKI